MNNIRKWFALVAAIVVAALAMPAFAQNVKYFTLGAPTSVSVSATSVQVTFKNVENGNSSFNSIGIKGTASGGATITINSGSASPGGPGTPATTGDGYYYLTGISPVKKGQTLTVTLNVTITGSGCSAGKITWHGRAFTGSPSQPSTEFQQQNANPETVVNMGCSYSITGTTPSSMPRGTTKPLTARVTNAAGSPIAITSVTLTPPVGGAITTPTNTYAPSIAAGTYADLAITATASCDTAKTAGSWTSYVAGFSHSGEPSTSLTGACALTATAPKSIVPGEQFTVELKAVDGEGGTIGGYTGSVTLVLTEESTAAGCTIVGTQSVPAVGGLASITVSLSVANATTTACTLKGTASIDGKIFDTAPLSLTVFDGTLACRDGIPDALSLPLPATVPPTSFNESVGGTAPGQTGFVAGVRGRGGKDPCGVDINYAVYNNIPTPVTGSSMTDPLGNKVPPGFYSFTWDVNQVEKPIIAVIATYKPEWGDAATGLPTHKTLICTIVPTLTLSGWVGCTSAPYIGTGDLKAVNEAGGWKAAPACLGTLVTHSSLPVGEMGCVASERWDVVAASECEGSPPTGAVPPEGRCLRPTSIMIMGKDPVFGR